MSPEEIRQVILAMDNRITKVQISDNKTTGWICKTTWKDMNTRDYVVVYEAIPSQVIDITKQYIEELVNNTYLEIDTFLISKTIKEELEDDSPNTFSISYSFKYYTMPDGILTDSINYRITSGPTQTQVEVIYPLPEDDQGYDDAYTEYIGVLMASEYRIDCLEKIFDERLFKAVFSMVWEYEDNDPVIPTISLEYNGFKESRVDFIYIGDTIYSKSFNDLLTSVSYRVYEDIASKIVRKIEGV